LFGNNEPVSLTRDCDAVIIPAGDVVRLNEGTSGFITQALGGSFTLYVEGNLFRIAGLDADAIGKQPIEIPALPPNASQQDVEELIWAQMATCYDPEIPINVVELGLIYECNVNQTGDDEYIVDVKMTLTAPGCGMGPILIADVQEKIEIIPTVKRADVELVFDPPWDQTRMSDEARLEAGLM